jgi:tyrosinase
MRLAKTIVILSTMIIVQGSFAQRIRTDHREMTPGQKTAYVRALNAIGTTIGKLADHHVSHFETEIHTRGNNNGTQFLPWHRVFQLDFEEKLRSAGTSNSQYLTVPYWDWTDENTATRVTWDDSDFLAISNLNWTISRSLGGSSLATKNDAISLLAMTGGILPASLELASPTSAFFSKRLENWHNAGHGFVGGTMNSFASPNDPVFYLHHGFVDKLWQDWENRDNAIQSVFNFSSLIHDYSPINPNAIIDSRYTKYPISSNSILEVDVWYAYNKKLLLDGLAGDFNVTGINKVYSYTPWNSNTSLVEGSIYAGDVQRDASDNIILDNKGGFVVKKGANCQFESGKEIRLLNGFKAEAGSSFTAKIVSTPYGFSSPISGRESTLLATTDLEKSINKNTDSDIINTVKLYPNPIKDELNIEFDLSQESLVSITIYNSLGQLVYDKNNFSLLSPGNYSEKIPCDNYPVGIYTVCLKVNNYSKIIKVLK